MAKPVLIRAGDRRLGLGFNLQPPLVDVRIVAEVEYQRMIGLLDRAEMLVGNPAANISGSCDLACENWQKDYKQWKAE